MKIDFNGKGMAIRFDKVPKLIYFNEESYGCGTVLLDGKTIKALSTVDVHAHTVDDKGRHPLSYSVEFYNQKTHEVEAIATGKRFFDKGDCLTVSLKIMDMEPFKAAIADIKRFTEDKRIPEEIRNEYLDNFIKTINDKA